MLIKRAQVQKALACSMALIMMTGCYRHVVRAEGPGASGATEIHEPNLREDQGLLGTSDPAADPAKKIQSPKAPNQKAPNTRSSSGN